MIVIILSLTSASKVVIVNTYSYDTIVMVIVMVLKKL